MKNFKFINNVKETIAKLFKTNKKLFILTIILIAIMIVIFISTFFSSSKKTSQSESSLKSQGINDYAESVENKLSSMLLSLDAISSAKVFVMVDSTPEIKYLTESEEQVTENASGSSTTTKTTTVVFEKNGSISTPVAITTIMPKITGVLIVTNKISASTKINIINSVSIVLNIDSSSISILQET